MDEWHANPFDLSQPQLHTLPSGVAASYTFFQDLYRCNESNTFLGKCINDSRKWIGKRFTCRPKKSQWIRQESRSGENRKTKSFCRLPLDEDSLRQHIGYTNYKAYLMRNLSLYNHPIPISNLQWLDDRKLGVPALPVNLKSHAANHSNDYAD